MISVMSANDNICQVYYTKLILGWYYLYLSTLNRIANFALGETKVVVWRLNLKSQFLWVSNPLSMRYYDLNYKIGILKLYVAVTEDVNSGTLISLFISFYDMNETKYYDVIPFDGNGRVLDGFIVTKHSSLTILIAWSENIIMIYNFNESASSRKESEIVSLDNVVKTVFNCGNKICCCDSEGSLFYLEKDVHNLQLHTEEEDMFDSYDSEQVDVDPLKWKSIYKSSLGNVQYILPVRYGFTAVVELSGKLFVEVYQISDESDCVTIAFSCELCYLSTQVVNVARSYNLKCVNPELVHSILGDISLLNSEVIFIGLSDGQIYCVPVMCSDRGPKLMYSSPHAVTDILLIPGKPYWRLATVLSIGIFVEICTANHLQLNYNIAYLPGPIQVVNVSDDNFVASNGQDLFVFHVDSDMNLHSKLLSVKGIHLISNHTQAGHLIAATVFGTLYHLYNLGIHDMILKPVRKFDNTQTLSLSELLKKLEYAKQEINVENQVTEALSLIARSQFLQKLFNISVKVDDYIKKTNKDGKYLLKISISNCSDYDFSSTLWHLQFILKESEYSTVQNVTFCHTFKKGADINTEMWTQIKNPTNILRLDCYLVYELPPLDSINFPWLLLYCHSAELDVSHFLSCSLSLNEEKRGDIENTSTIEMSYIKVLAAAVSQNSDNSTIHNTKNYLQWSRTVPLVQISKPVNTFWNSIFINSQHRWNEEVQKWYQDQSRGSSLWLHAGPFVAKMTINNNCNSVDIQSDSISMLHALRKWIIVQQKSLLNQKETVSLDCWLVNIAQQLKIKLELDKLEPSLQVLETLRKEWRVSTGMKLIIN